jgi:hypothetical protein
MASRPGDAWPTLPLAPWIETRDTLHMWLQIVGKIRLRQSPPINHSWHTTLYLTARGLTTSPMPHGDRMFQIDLDLLDHRLIVQADDGATGGFPLEPMPVKAFHARLLDELARLRLPVRIHGRPNEVPDAIPFAVDDVHHEYDADAVQRFWRATAQVARVFTIFRGRFVGKCSPVHLFWGALDLAVTRFSGREAPPHPGGIPNMPDEVTREAYSHEVSSAGFWPGTAPIDYPAFYSYAYPEPAGFAEAVALPQEAFYSPDVREFILPYDVVRASPDPDATLLAFLESTYRAAARLATWDPRLSR